MKFKTLYLILLLLFIPVESFCWTAKTYRKIAVNSVRLVPEVLKEIMEENSEELVKGAVYPMRSEEKEIHYLHINGDFGKADLMVKKLMDECIEDIKTQKPFKDIVFKMGVIGHLVSDVNNPLHTSDMDDRESMYYDDYMKYVERKQEKFVLTFDGYEPTFFKEMNISGYLGNSAKRAFSNYQLLSSSYFKNGRLRSSYEFDDRSTPFGIASNSYSHSVSDTAKIWTYLWYKAGGNMRRTPYLRGL